MARVGPKKTQKTSEKTVWNPRLAFLGFIEECKLLHTCLAEVYLYGPVYELPVCLKSKSVRSANLRHLNVSGLTLADLGAVSHAHQMEARLHG